MSKASVFQTIQQRLTASWPFVPGRHPLRRTHYVMSAFIFGATAVASALGVPTQVVRAADVEARLQVFVTDATIHDDNEGIFGGSGEMEFTVDIWRCPAWAPLPCRDFDQVGQITGDRTRFNASSGDTVGINRLIPQLDSPVRDPGSPPGTGFQIYAGYHHVLQFTMKERDSLTSSDDMGEVVHIIGTDDYGLGIGTHTATSSSGDYTITYEIRRAPLPDLRPVDIKVQDQADTTKKLVCMVVSNSDGPNAGPFDASLRIDGAVPTGGKPSADGVASGYWRDLCVETEALAAGHHTLTATVDELGAVPEFNESNNVLERAYVDTAPAPAS